MKTFLKSILTNLFWLKDKTKAHVFIDKTKLDDYPDIEVRANFYFQSAYRIVKYSGTLDLYLKILTNGPVRVLFTSSGINSVVVNNYFFNVDYKENPNDGWAWHSALTLMYPISDLEIQKSHERLLAYHKSLPKFDSSLVLGTGPSVAKARKLTNLSLYKIACNTIVKDQKLWIDLKPHFIVAGDAIYHYAHNLHATSFRNDLKICLRQHEVLFLFPALYYPFLKREFKDFLHLL